MNFYNNIGILKSCKSISLFLIITMFMWALGIPFYINQVNAATLTSVKDTLSDSDIGVSSDHEIKFTTPTGIAAGETILLTFPLTFGTAGLDFADMDLNSNNDGEQTLGATASGATWGVSTTTTTITFTSGTSTITAGSILTIEIGTNATGGVDQMTNPGTAQSYEWTIGGTMSDSGAFRIAIIDDVTVTATIATTLTFTVSGLNAGVDINGDTTTGTTTATSMAFGTIDVGAGNAKILGQQLSVSTNAGNGFTVTVVQDQNLNSGSADIDLYADGAASSTPSTWVSPSGNVSDEDTWGHYGITSEDQSLSGGNEFGSQLYAGNIGTAREIFYHTGPSDGSTAHSGQTEVAIKLEITSLQEAASDYTNVLTYVVTPIF